MNTFPKIPVFIFLFFFVFLLFFSLIIEFHEVGILIPVGDYMGLNVNGSALYYGTIIPGYSAKRSVIISSNDHAARIVYLTLRGKAGSWIHPDLNRFPLRPFESRHISFEAKVPEKTPYGNYYGLVRIIILKKLI